MQRIIICFCKFLFCVFRLQQPLSGEMYFKNQNISWRFYFQLSRLYIKLIFTYIWKVKSPKYLFPLHKKWSFPVRASSVNVPNPSPLTDQNFQIKRIMIKIWPGCPLGKLSWLIILAQSLVSLTLTRGVIYEAIVVPS